MQFRAPTGRPLGARLLKAQGGQASHGLRLQRGSNRQPQRRLWLGLGVQLARGGSCRLNSHQLLPPAAAIAANSVYSEGIKHFVGQHHPPQRCGRQLLEAAPAGLQAGLAEPFSLAGRHAWVGFHQHQFRAGGQLRPALGKALGQLQRQLSLPWSGFHQGQRTIASGGQFAEPGGNLAQQQGGEIRPQGGGGGEIPPRPNPQQATAVGAVNRIVQHPVHVGAEGHGAAGRLESG